MARYNDSEEETEEETPNTVFTNEKPDLAGMVKATDSQVLELVGDALGMKTKNTKKGDDAE